MKALFPIIAMIALTACGGTDQVYGLGAISQKVEGDENAVSVFNVWSAGDAQPLADRHCAQFGKKAIFTRTAGITAYFDCNPA